MALVSSLSEDLFTETWDTSCKEMCMNKEDNPNDNVKFALYSEIARVLWTWIVTSPEETINTTWVRQNFKTLRASSNELQATSIIVDSPALDWTETHSTLYACVVCRKPTNCAKMASSDRAWRSHSCSEVGGHMRRQWLQVCLIPTSFNQNWYSSQLTFARK